MRRRTGIKASRHFERYHLRNTHPQRNSIPNFSIDFTLRNYLMRRHIVLPREWLQNEAYSLDFRPPMVSYLEISITLL
jgi:hypothetical protein